MHYPTQPNFWKQLSKQNSSHDCERAHRTDFLEANYCKNAFFRLSIFLIPQTGSKKCQKNSSQHLVPLMGLL